MRGGATVLQGVKFDDAEIFNLPGRDVRYLIGPKTTDARNVTVGVCHWPEGSAPEGHVHEKEEETIYIMAGTGKISSPEGSVDLAPGTAVFIPVGTLHAIESYGPGTLEFVTIFSPPVVFGQYSAKT
jgi:putative monooxygenase